MEPENFGYIPVPEAYTRAAYESPMLVRVNVGDTKLTTPAPGGDASSGTGIES